MKLHGVKMVVFATVFEVGRGWRAVPSPPVADRAQGVLPGTDAAPHRVT